MMIARQNIAELAQPPEPISRRSTRHRLLFPAIAAYMVAFANLLPHAAKAATSASDVAAAIKANGPASEVANLWKAPAGPDRTQYDDVMDQVKQGSHSWLQIAADLYPATDAGSRFTLLNSVNLAIQNNPRDVLALVDTVFRIDDVCENRLIEPTPEASRIFLEKTRAALRSVKGASLMSRRDACLKLLS